jgi:hypothetical protein
MYTLPTEPFIPICLGRIVHQNVHFYPPRVLSLGPHFCGVTWVCTTFLQCQMSQSFWVILVVQAVWQFEAFLNRSPKMIKHVRAPNCILTYIHFSPFWHHNDERRCSRNIIHSNTVCGIGNSHLSSERRHWISSSCRRTVKSWVKIAWLHTKLLEQWWRRC